MIHKNIKFGKTKGVTWVQTGTGDVISTRSLKSPKGRMILAFTNGKKGPIGVPRDETFENWDELKPQLIFEFSSIESIDALILALNDCKKGFSKPGRFVKGNSLYFSTRYVGYCDSCGKAKRHRLESLREPVSVFKCLKCNSYNKGILE